MFPSPFTPLYFTSGSGSGSGSGCVTDVCGGFVTGTGSGSGAAMVLTGSRRAVRDGCVSAEGGAVVYSSAGAVVSGGNAVEVIMAVVV